MFTSPNDQSQSELVYQFIKQLQIGEGFKYDELYDATGVDIQVARSAWTAALRRLERNDRRTMVCEHGIGYSMIDAKAHEGVAFKHTKKSQRQLTKSIQKVRSADRNLLTPEEARRFDEIHTRNATIRTMVGRGLDKSTKSFKLSTPQGLPKMVSK